MSGAHRIEIEYCRKCRFLLRASWMAQELLSTFEEDLDEVTLIPGTGGIFEVRLNGEVIASNRTDKKMPDPPAVKRAIRDRISPDRRIGHDPIHPEPPPRSFLSLSKDRPPLGGLGD
jgi:selenoprotein W-related protein